MSTPADSVCSDTMYLLLTGVMCRLRAAKGNRLYEKIISMKIRDNYY